MTAFFRKIYASDLVVSTTFDVVKAVKAEMHEIETNLTESTASLDPTPIKPTLNFG